MGLQCLSDSSVFCHDITHVKHFKDLEFFCSVGAHKVLWKLFWILKPYLRSPSSTINDVISEFLGGGAPVNRRR